MLTTSLYQQMVYALRAAALGAALGFFYDGLRALRTGLRLRRWGTAALDGLFCLCGLASFLLLMLRGTDGRLRLYLPLGLGLGLLAYRGTVSPWVLRGLLWLLRLGGQALRFLRDGLLWMFSFPRGN